ncbi:unnamed protein product [Triticum turgidum subsp. durum]|uniref:Uncharacterized protein n=1 Tax=Triticum turgidum subsp. durum TaxID=4567 RepID=A0A9R1BFY9_TRITD|nr:unnamed protein product [Triticum turgidum subsp. durum]
MELVTGATSSLLPKLGALLQDEYQLQDKVRKDVESLQSELVFMSTILRMVAQVPPDQLHEHVWIWYVFLKDISYDMEDVMITFAARVHRAPHLDSLITKAFNMLCMGRAHHQIANMVEEVRSLIKEVADMRSRYQLDNIVTKPATLRLVVPTPWYDIFVSYSEEITRRHSGIKYAYPVGIEEDMKQVLHNWIIPSDSDGHTTLLSIVGPAGVGKTTIAMALYQNYGDYFQPRAMVNMSRDSQDLKKVLVDILNQLKPQELQGHDGDMDHIKAELH